MSPRHNATALVRLNAPEQSTWLVQCRPRGGIRHTNREEETMAEPSGELQLNGPDLVLANLSGPEVDQIRERVEVVLIPVGSNDQHGPNLAVSMDIVGASEFCRRASI